MSRLLSIVCSMLVIGSVLADSGCSSPTNPSLVSHAGAAGVAKLPQSGGHWTTKAPMPTPRYFLASGVVNGKLYAIGGVTTGNIPVSAVEAYDPATDTW